MKKIVFILCNSAMLLIPVYMQAQESIPQKLTLSDCIRIAIKNNLDVQKTKVQSETAYINMLQSRENIFPVFNASVVHGINEGRSIDPYTNTYVNQQISYGNQELGGSLLLFNGLALQNLIRESTYAFRATKEREQLAKDNLSLNIILVYLQVLTNKDLLTLVSAQRETTTRQLERMDELNRKGAIAPNLYYDLKGQLMNDELQEATNKNTLENSKIALAQLLNISYSKNLELQPMEADSMVFNDDTNPEVLYKNAEQNLAWIKAADLNLKSAAMRVKYARSGYFPAVYLRGGLASNFSSAAYNSDNQQIGYADQVRNNLGKSLNVNVTIPIFNNLRVKNAVSIAKLNQLEAQRSAETSRIQLQQLTGQAYLNMVTSRERCSILSEQVRAFSESFRSADVRFNLGVINSTDYLITKNNLDKAKINLIIARYDFILRKKVVDFYEGKGVE